MREAKEWRLLREALALGVLAAAVIGLPVLAVCALLLLLH